MKRVIAAIMMTVFAVMTTVGVYAAGDVEIVVEDVELGLEGFESVEPVQDVDVVETVDDLIIDEAADTEDAELMAAAQMATYFEQDFTKWQSDDLSNASTGIGTISKHELQVDSVSTTVADGALTMIASGSTAEQGMMITPVSSIAGKNVTFNFMLKKEEAVNGSSTERNIYLLSGDKASAGKYKIIKMDSKGVISRSTATADASLREGDSALTAPQVVDGYYNISVDFCLDEYNSKECWSAYLYDANNSNQLFYEVHWSKDKFPSGLKNVWFMSYRDSSARNNGAMAPVTIKNPVITEMADRPDLFVQVISQPSGQLEAGQKNIQIKFNKSVDPATLGEITFTKADGTSVKGGAYVSAGETADIVNVAFGRLEVGDYKLNITSDLKTADGKSAAEAEYNYTVTSTQDTPYIKHDFSKWSSGDLSNTSLGEGTITSISEVSAADPIEYSVSGGYLQAKPVGASNVAAVFLPNRDTEGKDTIFTFKLKANSVACKGDGYRYIGLYNGKAAANARNIEMLKFNHDGSMTTLDKKSPIKGAWTAPSIGEQDGCYHLKFRICREIYDNKDCWGVYVYDFNRNDGELIYNVHWTVSNAEAFPNGIMGITFGAYRNGASVNAGDDFSMFIKEPLLVTDVENMKAAPVYNSGNGAQPDIEEITVIYDEEIDSALFTTDTVSLLDGDKELAMSFSVDAAARKLVVKPVNYLEYGKSYTVGVNTMKIVDSEFTTAKRPVTITDVSVSGTTATVTTSGAVDGTGSVIMGMYKADGTAIGFMQKPLGTTVTFTDVDADAEVIKVFATEQQTGFTRKAGEVFTYTAE